MPRRSVLRRITGIAAAKPNAKARSPLLREAKRRLAESKKLNYACFIARCYPSQLKRESAARYRGKQCPGAAQQPQPASLST